MIAWMYLDKLQAARDALRDYRDMARTAAISPGEVGLEYEGMSAPAASPPAGAGPPSRDPRAGEARLAAALDRVDVLRERHRAASEFLGWFEPAWLSLSEGEREVLAEYYATGSLRSGANARMQARLGLGRAQVDRARQRALARLALLLYGK